MASTDRTLVIIGGKEDRTADKIILGEIAKRVGSGKLVVSTVAMQNNPGQIFDEYEKAFRALGVKHLYKLEINSRDEAKSDAKVRILDDAEALFFYGWRSDVLTGSGVHPHK